MFPGTRIEDCATENTCNVNIGKIHSEVVNPCDGLRRLMPPQCGYTT